MVEIIRDLNRQGIAFLVVEHNIPLVLDLCDPVAVLSRGQGRSRRGRRPSSAPTRRARGLPRARVAAGRARSRRGARPGRPVREGQLTDADHLGCLRRVRRRRRPAGPRPRGAHRRDHLHRRARTAPASPRCSASSAACSSRGSGTIDLDGTRLDQLGTAGVLGKGVAQVPQSQALFPQMTIRENVLLGGYTLRRDKQLLTKRYDRVGRAHPDRGRAQHTTRRATSPAASAAWSRSPAA